MLGLAAVLRRRREQQAQLRGEEHRRRQLQTATDHAITAAVRAQLAEPCIDLNVEAPVRVTVGDVLARAHDDFALDVPRQHAAAMLRERLQHRGVGAFGTLISDVFDTP